MARGGIYAVATAGGPAPKRAGSAAITEARDGMRGLADSAQRRRAVRRIAWNLHNGSTPFRACAETHACENQSDKTSSEVSSQEVPRTEGDRRGPFPPGEQGAGAVRRGWGSRPPQYPCPSGRAGDKFSVREIFIKSRVAYYLLVPLLVVQQDSCLRQEV